jgi:hypothetical protein
MGAGCDSLAATFPCVFLPCDADVEIPPGVASVAADSSRFAQNELHPLLSAPPGSIIDPITTLDGCWGAYADEKLTGAALADYEFYEFDLEAGTVKYEVLQRCCSTGGVALEHGYSIDSIDSDGIVISLTSCRANLHDDGSLSDCGPVESTPQLDLKITTQDDAFRFGNSGDASPDFSAPHRSNLVFFRFDCPTESLKTKGVAAGIQRD